MDWKTILIFRLFKELNGIQHDKFPVCHNLTCIMPVDGAEFLTGSKFDIRVENHGLNVTQPSGNISVTVTRQDKNCGVDIEEFFGIKSQPLERWEFRYPRDNLEMFDYMDKKLESLALVQVASFVWRGVVFDKMGSYIAKVFIDGIAVKQVEWIVHSASCKPKAKNAILMIADGVNSGLITAARVMARKQRGGKYFNKLTIDKMDHFGHILTHSLDSMMTDSSNSASAYFTGHKTIVSAMGIYPDTSEDNYDDPKQELISELAKRRPDNRGGSMAVGIVTTAAIQDATPAALYSHAKFRYNHDEVLDQLLYGAKNASIPVVADVIMGGGGKEFEENKYNKNFFKVSKEEFGYDIVYSATELKNHNNDNNKLLGIFHKKDMDTYVDRKILPENLKGQKNFPVGKDKDADDQPLLVDMAIKALDILKVRGENTGFFAMIEGGLPDKKLHKQDFHRAIVDFIEFDKTVEAVLEWVKKNSPDTLVVVTADHGHGFDVYGSVDTEIFNKDPSEKTSDRYYSKSQAIGVYEDAGWPDYEDKDGDGYPDSLNVRTVFAAATNNHANLIEDFQMNQLPKIPSIKYNNSHHYKAYKPHPDYSKNGINVTTNLPPHAYDDVHSMTEVPVYASGPGSDLFARVMDNTEVFFKLADVLGLGIPDPDFCKVPTHKVCQRQL